MSVTTATAIIGLIKTASDIAVEANKLAKEVKPLTDQIDVKATADAAVGITKGAVGATKSAAGITKGVASKMAGATKKLSEKKSDVADNLKIIKAEREARKALKEARQAVLENATTTMQASELIKKKEKTKKSEVLEGIDISPVSKLPGSFVIATYKKLDFDKDLTDYVGIYVGKGEDLSEAVEKAISCYGNPDVYADVKYEQNVHIYLFNCMPEQLDEQYEGLLQAFTDERLYNR